jgi:hypothetical protein
MVAGGAAAIFLFEGSERTGLTWPLGQAHSAEALPVALAMLFNDDVPPPPPPIILYLLWSSTSALQAIMNSRSSKSASKAALMFHHWQSLTTITLHHSYVRYQLVWTSLDEELEGQMVTRTLALEASRIDPLDGANRVQSAAFQKKRARDHAFMRWDMEWHFSRAQNTLKISATGIPPDSE